MCEHHGVSACVRGKGSTTLTPAPAMSPNSISRGMWWYLCAHGKSTGLTLTLAHASNTNTGPQSDPRSGQNVLQLVHAQGRQSLHGDLWCQVLQHGGLQAVVPVRKVVEAHDALQWVPAQQGRGGSGVGVHGSVVCWYTQCRGGMVGFSSVVPTHTRPTDDSGYRVSERREGSCAPFLAISQPHTPPPLAQTHPIQAL
jgi:hypothetical protein